MLSDLRLGLRSLRRHRLMSLGVVFILALGTMANTSLFAVLESVLLRSLPFANVDDLVKVHGLEPETGRSGHQISPSAFYTMAANDKSSLEGLAAIVSGRQTTFQVQPTSSGSRPMEVPGAVVSARLFSLLGAEASVGRLFRAEEDEPDQDDVVILANRLWKGRFGADPSILGRTLRLNDRPFTVIGVLRAGHAFPPDAELWIPNPRQAPSVTNLAFPVHSYFDVLGRLKTTASPESARRELEPLYKHALEAHPRSGLAKRLEVVPLQQAMTRRARPTLASLQAAGAAVLLIACTNVAGLLLVRSIRRRSELALRAVLGAPVSRLIRQLTVEHVLLFLSGGVAGVMGAHWALQFLIGSAPVSWTRNLEVELEPSTILFGLGVATVSGLTFGSIPAMVGARSDLLHHLQGNIGASTSRSRHRAGDLAVVVQVALAIALLVVSGLLGRTLLKLQQQELGFEPTGLLAARVKLLESRYPSREARRLFLERVQTEFGALPGVDTVSGSQYFFLTDGSYRNSITGASGEPNLPEGAQPVPTALVLSGYFDTLGIDLVRGRSFSEQAFNSRVPEAVVSRSFAEKLWPNGEALGKHLEFEGRRWTVIGIADDVKSPGLSTQEPPHLFLPYPLGLMTTGEVTFLARTLKRREDGIAEAIHARLRELDPAQTLVDVVSVGDLVRQERAPQRYSLKLVGGFAGCAILLAATGMYALLSFTVTTRSRELGIRMSLGAGRARVGWEIVTKVLAVGCTGIAAGCLLAGYLGQGLQNLLFGVEPWDAASWTAALVVGGAVVLLAAWFPVQRAARLDPAALLRED